MRIASKIALAVVALAALALCVAVMVSALVHGPRLQRDCVRRCAPHPGEMLRAGRTPDAPWRCYCNRALVEP